MGKKREYLKNKKIRKIQLKNYKLKLKRSNDIDIKKNMQYRIRMINNILKIIEKQKNVDVLNKCNTMKF